MDQLIYRFIQGLRSLRSERAQTLVEYALIIFMVAVALVLALGLLAGDLDAFYQTAAGMFS